MASDREPRLPEHLPTLDGVRGLAILWVVVHNISVVDGPWFPGLLGHLFEAGLNSGWMAVTLFFALSGFLITGILLDSRSDPQCLRRFYLRRVLRIFPLYYAVLFIAFAVLPLLVHLPPRLAHDVPHQGWLWVYLSNWTEPYPEISSQAFPHFWSLAVEEQFYLVWPLVIRCCSPREALRACLAIAAGALVLRCTMLAGGASLETLYTFTFSRMDALALGGAGAAALRVPGWRGWLVARAGRWTLLALALLAVCLALVHKVERLNPLMQTLGYSLLGAGFACLMLGLASADAAGHAGWWSRCWRIRPLRVLAKYSYGMYVFHKILGDAVGRPLMRAHPTWPHSVPANLVYLFVGTLVTLGAAMLSYHAFEKRFLKMKPLLLGRAAPAAAA